MNICVDLDVDELMWEMSRRDKNDMIIALLDEISETDFKEIVNKLKNDKLKSYIGDTKTDFNDFDVSILSLIGKSFRMTNEEEDTIMRLSERYS